MTSGCRKHGQRADLAVRYGRDGYLLLRQVHGPGAPGWLAGAARGAGAAPDLDPAVLPAGRRGRGEGDLAGGRAGPPPARSRLVSPYDTDARYAEKRGKGWTGYKVHLSETCHIPDADGHRPAPDLLTNTETTWPR